MLIPNVVDKTYEGHQIFDIYSRLLNDRIIFINGEINDDLSNLVISELLYLDSINHDDIHMYINSPGGSVSSGLAIYDVMNYIKSDVETIGMGLCASMASFLLSSGSKGKRYSLQNTEIMIHEVISESSGKATDIINETNHLIKIKNRMNKILANNTNKTIKQIEKDTKVDNYMDSTEALNYHLIDKIIKER